MNAPEMLRIPPNSAEAEQALIGGLLLDNRQWDDIGAIVRESDFYRDDHRRIWSHMAALINTGKPADVLTVGERIEAANESDQTGGLAYLATMAAESAGAAMAKSYAGIVAEKARLRALWALGDTIRGIAEGMGTETARERLDAIEYAVTMAADKSAPTTDESWTLADCLSQAVEALEVRYERDDPISGQRTGLKDLDEKLCGLQGGDLIIIAGRPSMGKTAIAMNIAEHVAVEERKPVAVFSLEMGRQQLADRMLASVGQIDLGRIRSGKLQDEDWDRMTGALGKMHESPMHIDERATSVVQIRARARRLHRKTPLALIVIDYLQLMTEAKGDNRNEQLSNVTRALKLLARELQVPVICLSQLSRKVEDRGDKRPMLSDLRDSGAIEQDADVVILMFREEYYRDGPKGIAEAIVAKQRMGETGTIKLAWQGHHSRFRDLAPEDWAVINEAAQSKPKRGFRGD